MKKVIITIVLWSIVAISAMGASALAKVEESNIQEGSSVQLILEASGENIEFPQINDIGGYPIDNSSNIRSSALKVINGAMTQENTEQLLLSFTPDKAMTIPSFKIKVDGKEIETQPIDIKIFKSAPQPAGGSSKFALDMVASKQSVYVGEPLMLSVFFSESRDAELMKLAYQKPQTKDFFVKEVEKEKISRRGNYVVHELRYVLIPKNEGNLTIEPARVKIAERSRKRDDFFGTFMDTPAWSQIASKPLSLKVKPTPNNTDLVGDFNLVATIDSTEVKANKPVNLTIKITGEGDLEDFAGARYEIDGVTIYSDDAKIESALSGNQFTSSYEKKYVFIADHNFTIPAQSFSLFDPKTGTVKKLEIGSYSIKVTGGNSVSPSVIGSVSPKSAASNKEQEISPKREGEDRFWLSWYWIFAAAFGSGAALTLLGIKGLPYLKRQKSAQHFSEGEALKILYPHTNESAEVEETVRKLYLKKRGEKGVVIDKKKLKELIQRYRK